MLIIRGDQDLICNVDGVNAMVDAMSWVGATGYSTNAVKKDWFLDGKFAGSYASDRGLSHVILGNASHMAPYDRGDSALDMFNRLVGVESAGVLVETGEKPTVADKSSGSGVKATHGLSIFFALVALGMLGYAGWWYLKKRKGGGSRKEWHELQDFTEDEESLFAGEEQRK